ncbi:class I SAM-dependent methyltransferase [Paenibacillus lutrae]|uniref:Small RNA 2'-O-methyltransferase n=1 Tax=Paenibacillus lutrae TaxID=2078573 RepID=A0A7X3FK07_9BACL|nr:class I SAM-dependent methyltransferase [Paenibacillus lutrae]MVP01038.1 methyltransferase domain-containing protein [Paenibacillus lutrae]
MAIFQVKSTNPDLSFIIKKNPGSGMMLRSVRKGTAYGWYTDSSTFNVYFKDADNEISYKRHQDENFEYLNVSRYNTPLFPLNALNEFFSAPLKVRDDRDTDGYENTCTIPVIHVQLVRYVEFFEKHLPDFNFTLTHLTHKSYSLTVTTGRSLYQLLNVVSVLCLFLAQFGEEYIDISDNILDKYISSIHVIDAPFYIRSLFARNFLTSKERFKEYKAKLEQTDRYSILFDFGSTAHQRRNYIRGVLPFDKSILDLGCGEGFYAIPFAGKIEGSYYAVDIHEETLEVVKRKASAKELDNLVALASIEAFLEGYNGEQVDVLLTEVIEHMSLEEARELIKQVCTKVDFHTFVITTPNADFNGYYELEGFRHDDHKWEMGLEEFRRWFTDLAGELEAEAGPGGRLRLDYTFAAIGDGVNGVQTTQGVIVKNKEAVAGGD